MSVAFSAPQHRHTLDERWWETCGDWWGERCLWTCEACQGLGAHTRIYRKFPGHHGHLGPWNAGYKEAPTWVEYPACQRCAGTGAITYAHRERVMAGYQHLSERVARHEGICHCARRLGISAAALRGYENDGLACPEAERETM